MEKAEQNILQKIAHTVRALSADAIEKQQSGHPGLALGTAEIGTYLFARVLRQNPKNPNWIGRDRFVLSAGHGSMLLYSLLHLCGYDWEQFEKVFTAARYEIERPTLIIAKTIIGKHCPNRASNNF